MAIDGLFVPRGLLLLRVDPVSDQLDVAVYHKLHRGLLLLSNGKARLFHIYHSDEPILCVLSYCVLKVLDNFCTGVLGKIRI